MDASTISFKSVLLMKGKEDPAKQYPFLFSDMLSKSTTSGDLSARLLAFLDIIFDIIFDVSFNQVLDVLIPHIKILISACSAILNQFINTLVDNQFLIKTTLLLIGSIIGDHRVSPNNDSFTVFRKITIQILDKKHLPESAAALEGLKRALKSSSFRSFFIENHGHMSLPSIIDLAFT